MRDRILKMILYKRCCFLGAWTRILNYEQVGYTAHDLALNETNDMKLYLKKGSGRYISKSGLEALVASGLYKQIRFYCSSENPGKTLHLKTLPTEIGMNVLKAYGTSGSVASSCNSYEVYPDDTSYTAKNCDKWVRRRALVSDIRGYWNFYYSHKLFTAPIFIASKTAFTLGYTPYVYTRCDNYEDTLNGKWEVFVR